MYAILSLYLKIFEIPVNIPFMNPNTITTISGSKDNAFAKLIEPTNTRSKSINKCINPIASYILFNFSK